MNKNNGKAANGAGSIDRRKSPKTGKLIWWVRVSLPDGRRKRIPLLGSEKMSEAMAREKAAYYSTEAREGRLVFDVEPRANAAQPSGPALTVRQLADAWTSGELFTTYGGVNGLGPKANAKIDAWSLKAHVLEAKTRGASAPAFGDLRVADVKDEDAERVMAMQPKEHRAQTKIHCYARLRRMFELAIFPLRLRKDNPVSKYLRPQRDAEKLFCFLYPSEVLALLVYKAIPLGRRVLYALAVYTGQRKGSLYALRWKHVDLAHGTLASFKTKTGRAQYFVGDPGLMRVLDAWYDHKGRPDGDQPIVGDGDVACLASELAKSLRGDLLAAGVSRALLFEDKADNVEPLRFHDCRSTFCSWARRLGKSDAWISERTGHEIAGDMINRYDRGAQTLADLDYAPFPDITSAIPELAPDDAPVAIPAAAEASALATPLAFVGSDLGESEVSGSPENAIATPRYTSARPGRFELPTTGSVVRDPPREGHDPAVKVTDHDRRSGLVDDAKSAEGRPGANAVGHHDAVEVALADALTKAATAGRFDVVAQLAKEIEARRLARAAVVDLATHRAIRFPR